MATPWQPMATVPYPRDGKPFVFWRVNPQAGYPQWDVAPSHVEYEEALALGEETASHWMRPDAPDAESEPSLEDVIRWLKNPKRLASRFMEAAELVEAKD